METGGGQDLTEVCRFIEGILHPRQCMRRPSLRFGRNVTVWRSRAELQGKRVFGAEAPCIPLNKRQKQVKNKYEENERGLREGFLRARLVLQSKLGGFMRSLVHGDGLLLTVIAVLLLGGLELILKRAHTVSSQHLQNHLCRDLSRASAQVILHTNLLGVGRVICNPHTLEPLKELVLTLVSNTRTATKLVMKLHAHSVQYAYKLASTRRALENTPFKSH
eukprot:1148457-Pelagomonas_calceolata.AAC.2